MNTPYVLVIWLGLLFGIISAAIAHSVDAMLTVIVVLMIAGGFVVGKYGTES